MNQKKNHNHITHAFIISAMLFSAITPLNAKETGFINSNGTWSYVNEDGSKATGWIKEDGCWYAFDADGAMRTGWIASNEHWYFMGESGVMQSDAWVEDNGAKYYIKGTGVMAKDYVKDGYELTSEGKAIPLGESGSVVVTDPAELEGKVIEGNLYVDVTTARELELKGVTVKGKLVVLGDNKTAGKVTLTDSTVETINTQSRNAEVVLSGKTEVKNVVIEETAKVTPDKNYKGEVENIEVQSTTKGEVVIEVPAENVSTRTYATVDVQAPVGNLEVKTDTQVKVNADVKNVTVTETAKDTTVEVAKGSTVGTITADAPVKIDGKGTVEKVEANVDGVEAGKDTTIKDVETGKDVTEAPDVTKPDKGGSSGGSGGGSSTVINPESIEISNTESILYVNETLQLNMVILPENATNKSVIWTSSDSTIAEVNNQGRVLGKKAGEVILKAKTSNGKEDTIQLTVKVKPESIKIKDSILYLKPRDELSLDYSVTPIDVDKTDIIWTSSNESIAMVEDGKVSALSSGETVINADILGIKSDCRIIVSSNETVEILDTILTDINKEIKKVSSSLNNTGIGSIQLNEYNRSLLYQIDSLYSLHQNVNEKIGSILVPFFKDTNVKSAELTLNDAVVINVLNSDSKTITSSIKQALDINENTYNLAFNKVFCLNIVLANNETITYKIRFVNRPQLIGASISYKLQDESKTIEAICNANGILQMTIPEKAKVDLNSLQLEFNEQVTPIEGNAVNSGDLYVKKIEDDAITLGIKGTSLISFDMQSNDQIHWQPANEEQKNEYTIWEIQSAFSALGIKDRRNLIAGAIESVNNEELYNTSYYLNAHKLGDQYIITLVPKSTTNTATVNYIAFGAKLLAISLPKGIQVVPYNLEKAGYEFEGWYVDSEYKELYDFDNSLSNTLNLYGKYTRTSEKLSDIFDNYATESEFVISTINDYREFINIVNGENKDFKGKTVILNNDLDFEGEMLLPIGINNFSFNGSFDGRNYTLSNITMLSPSERTGLFGTLGNGASIKNLVLHHITLNTTNNAAGLVVGDNRGTIYNVHVFNSALTGASYIGGITGYNYGTIENSSVINSQIKTSGWLSRQVGGIAAQNGNVINCMSNAEVSGTYSAGLLSTNGSIINSYHYGTDNKNIYGRTDGNMPKITASYKLSELPMTKEELISAGWDFDIIWDWSEIYNLPILRSLQELDEFDLGLVARENKIDNTQLFLEDDMQGDPIELPQNSIQDDESSVESIS